MKSGSDVSRARDLSQDWPGVYLKQGDIHVSDGGPAQVRTILGSCVTITMYCPALKIGGITHSLLPFPLPGSGGAPPPGHRGRYVDSSIRYVFEQLLSRGITRSRLEVKIFGGGQMLLPVPGKPVQEKLNIGRRNVETALRIIQELGLNVTATDVGGHLGRKLLFLPHRGDVWVKKIARSGEQTGGKQTGANHG